MKCPKCGSTKTRTTNPGKRALAWGGEPLQPMPYLPLLPKKTRKALQELLTVTYVLWSITSALTVKRNLPKVQTCKTV